MPGSKDDETPGKLELDFSEAEDGKYLVLRELTSFHVTSNNGSLPVLVTVQNGVYTSCIRMPDGYDLQTLDVVLRQFNRTSSVYWIGKCEE